MEGDGRDPADPPCYISRFPKVEGKGMQGEEGMETRSTSSRRTSWHALANDGKEGHKDEFGLEDVQEEADARHVGRWIVFLVDRRGVVVVWSCAGGVVQEGG